jgi:hypothetical protein
MLKALVIKELRESAGFIAIAALAALYALAVLTGVRLMPVPYALQSEGFPFIGDSFYMLFVLTIGGLALAMGLKQSAVELARGTYYFLLHRPATRKFLIGTKLSVGAAAVLIIGGLLVLVYAFWAATPGNSPTPFFWSMTADAWQLWLGMSLIYLGAFLSGIRPARWFGTRLVPVVTAAVCVFFLAWIPWWWLELPSLAVCAGIFLASISYYARWRDY